MSTLTRRQAPSAVGLRASSIMECSRFAGKTVSKRRVESPKSFDQDVRSSINIYQKAPDSLLTYQISSWFFCFFFCLTIHLFIRLTRIGYRVMKVFSQGGKEKERVISKGKNREICFLSFYLGKFIGKKSL